MEVWLNTVLIQGCKLQCWLHTVKSRKYGTSNSSTYIREDFDSSKFESKWNCHELSIPRKKSRDEKTKYRVLLVAASMKQVKLGLHEGLIKRFPQAAAFHLRSIGIRIESLKKEAVFDWTFIWHKQRRILHSSSHKYFADVFRNYGFTLAKHMHVQENCSRIQRTGSTASKDLAKCISSWDVWRTALCFVYTCFSISDNYSVLLIFISWAGAWNLPFRLQD